MTDKTEDVKLLGIIAGGGLLPERLLGVCDTKGIDTFVVGFERQTDLAILKDRRYMLTRLGAAGQIINTLKAHKVRDLVLIGSIRRPSLKELRPDFRTLKFFLRLGLRAIGDDGLLKALRRELERDGFKIHAVQHFIEDIMPKAGRIGSREPTPEDMNAIRHGIKVAHTLGRLDIGQSVVMQQDLVLGVEGIEGTDELIRRCGLLKREGRGPILVKMSKPQQDESLDLPTIGPDTIHHAALAGYAGIAIEANRSLLLDPQKVADLADQYKMFVIGVDPDIL
ncbi:LpxI family protein [Micavibrio aeruginosavorus]|uniref:LpxI family protein n=1 Tax=Micavibrio aeruginosavorus TaxID=349221 RepID=UPI003F4AE8FD